MKAPKPSIPLGAPAGTVWFGGPIEWSRITFRVLGDDLDPDEITRLLRCDPHESERKGDPILRRDGTVARQAKTGSWRLGLDRDETDEWDCAEAMMELVTRLPKEIDLWKDLTGRFAVDLFVALSMPARNKGFSLSPEVMAYLGNRGIEAGFDIYYDEKSAEPAASHRVCQCDG
jgi:hypothetical protein